MRAIGNYLVISPIEEKEVTKSGFVLTGDDAKQIRYKKGEVLSSGTDLLKEGEVISYDRNAGHKMMLDGKVCHIIQIRDVVCVH